MAIVRRALEGTRRRPTMRRVIWRTSLLVLAACRGGSSRQSIPLPHGPPWVMVFATPGFRVVMDSSRIEAGPDSGTWFVHLLDLHDQPRGPDTLRFDRGRTTLLVRCTPLGFKSVSEDLALGDASPIFHQAWQLTGPHAVAWRAPDSGSTDDQLLRAACSIVTQVSRK